ncbi:TetR/AcrR family transcriptional regulator [Mesorhizobium sp. BHbdii]
MVSGRTTSLGRAGLRTRHLILKTAISLMQHGHTPSVEDVAEAADVSRGTAYRYFPSQSAMVEAIVDEVLGPILDWHSESDNAEERVMDLLASSMARIIEFEATGRAALKLSLEQWADKRAEAINPSDRQPGFRRGHRRELLGVALAPLRQQLTPSEFEQLAMALSLTYGIELIVVLKDIWEADNDKVKSVAVWAARTLIRAAISEATRRTSGGRND